MKTVHGLLKANGPDKKNIPIYTMKGGVAIAAGSQGCIFAPKLVQDGDFARNSPNPANAAFVSKVFTEHQVYKDEQRISALLSGVSNEGLVTVSPGAFTAAQGLGRPERISAAGVAHACGPVSRTNPVYVIHMPKIKGSIYVLPASSRPITFLTKAYNALMRMKFAKIIHGDMARRNIFYKDNDALIGDFGYSINLANPDGSTNGYDTFIRTFIARLPVATDDGIEYSLGQCFSFLDQLTIEATIALFLHHNWAKRKEIANVYAGIKNPGFYNKLRAGVYDMGPNSDNRQGILYINGNRCIDSVNTLMEAAAADIDHGKFIEATQRLMLKSDIKRFMQSAIKFINIPLAHKNTLLEEIVCKSNYLYFYRYAGIPIPQDIIKEVYKVNPEMLTQPEKDWAAFNAQFPPVPTHGGGKRRRRTYNRKLKRRNGTRNYRKN